jgi:hypothetical protein
MVGLSVVVESVIHQRRIRHRVVKPKRDLLLTLRSDKIDNRETAGDGDSMDMDMAQYRTPEIACPGSCP